MLKRAYVDIAQSIATLPPIERQYRAPRRGKPGLGRWALSLGAIYHFDRMVALDIP